MVDLATSLFAHILPDDGSIENLSGNNVLFLCPYKEQGAELRKQLKWALQNEIHAFQNIPPVCTIDQMHGHREEICCFRFAPGHYSLLGFLKEWRRLNVAFTRANSVLWIVGNIAALRTQLAVIVKHLKRKKLALTLIHYLDQGDLINVKGCSTLPRTERRERYVHRALLS
jgi:hypothetical protein